jgi:hypothetical protein
MGRARGHPGRRDRRAARGLAGSDALLHYECGEIADATFLAHVRTALAVTLTDAELADGWNAIFVGEMPGIRPLLARAQQVRPLYALSNTNAVHVSSAADIERALSGSARREASAGGRPRRSPPGSAVLAARRWPA